LADRFASDDMMIWRDNEVFWCSVGTIFTDGVDSRGGKAHVPSAPYGYASVI